jgi:hypothetical protein
MKFVKQTAVAVALLSSIGSTWAWWGTNTYQGEVTADGGTRLIGETQASNTWDDWVWRGKQDGTVQFCATSSKGCSFTWGKSKSTSYAHTIGWSVGGGFGFEKGAFSGTVSGQYQQQRTWTQTQSENFDMRTDLSPGQWAEPVIVAVRRWKTGHFYGGHFADNVPRTNQYNYTYDWAWKNYGHWQGNEQQWGYKMIHVVWNRDNL